jgi:hypothetical protein
MMLSWGDVLREKMSWIRTCRSIALRWAEYPIIESDLVSYAVVYESELHDADSLYICLLSDKYKSYSINHQSRKQENNLN